MVRKNQTMTLPSKLDAVGRITKKFQEMQIQTDPIAKDAPKRVISHCKSENIKKDKSFNVNNAQVKKVNKPARDEYEAFGESIAMQLKNVKDQYAIAAAKFNIQKILFEAETGVYIQNKNLSATNRRQAKHNIKTFEDIAQAITESLTNMKHKPTVSLTKIYLQRVVFKAETGIYSNAPFKHTLK